MIKVLLNSIALDPNRWTKDKTPLYRLDQLLGPISKAGFHFMEVWEHHVSEESQAHIEAIREMANSLQLSFPVVGMYPQLHLEGEERLIESARIEKLLVYAKLLGATVVKIFVGTRSSTAITDKEYERSVEFIKETTSRAEALDLTITGETHQKTLFDTVESCKRFIGDVNSSRFKICYQPYDLRHTEHAINDYERLATDVIHVHYQGRQGSSMELLENSDLDYRKLTQALANRSFRGFICIEFTKESVVKDLQDFKLETVLSNARRDRDFILTAAQEFEMEVRA